MTAAQTIIICKTIADKYGSPTILDSEWVNHINMAQQEVLNRLIPDSLDKNGGVALSADFDYNTIEEIRPLIFPLALTPSSGLISGSAITSALRTASSDSSCEVFRLFNFSIASSNIPIQYVKHGALRAYQKNVFKEPTATYPRFTAVAGGYQIYPSIGLTVNITAVKTPKIVTNTGESLDWSDYMMNQVILLTCKIAGIGIRGEDLIQMIESTGVQSA